MTPATATEMTGKEGEGEELDLRIRRVAGDSARIQVPLRRVLNLGRGWRWEREDGDRRGKLKKRANSTSHR